MVGNRGWKLLRRHCKLIYEILDDSVLLISKIPYTTSYIKLRNFPNISSPLLYIGSEVNLLGKCTPRLGVQKPVRFRNLLLIVRATHDIWRIYIDLLLRDQF